MSQQPLHNVKVLDFSTLLPGPMCTLLLAEAGAEVIKVERPAGDEMRGYQPRLGTDSVNFVLLNRGKKSIAVDLKEPATRQQIEKLIVDADVLVEQFRPGVMDRLGLGYGEVSQINPRLIYCSITGYGQSGPDALVAAHDLNYQAKSGMLSLTADRDGVPLVPNSLTADLAGGAYPAVMNILLALRQREQTGLGCQLDISMADNLFTLMYWGLGNGWAADDWPKPAADLVTGASPRYQIYETADRKFLACAPIEEKFWLKFLALIGAPELASAMLSREAITQVAHIMVSQPITYWLNVFAGSDVCVNEVVNLKQAIRDPHFRARGLFNRTTTSFEGKRITALPTPLCSGFLSSEKDAISPALGQHTLEVLGKFK